MRCPGATIALLLFPLLGACKDSDAPADAGADGRGPCSSSNCLGCCSGDECLSGESPQACGNAGLTCVRCAAGSACAETGHCVTDPGKCRPKDCAGCCLGDRCAPGNSDEACGTAGAPCQRCSSSQTCRDGACRCTPETCPGCCEGDVCKSGETAAACGRGGTVCRACGASDACEAGECKPGSPCGDCPGCCEGLVCRPGTTPALCGRAGNPCRSCEAGESCAQGICNDPSRCSPESCGDCCAQSTCLPGTAIDACGDGGGLCLPCGKSHACSGGSCRVEPKSEWYLTVVSAAIDETLGTWDTLINTAPDPYVTVAIGTAFAESTSVQDNSYRPRWDEVIGVFAAGDVLTHDLQIEIRDSDPVGSELIGSCLVPVPDAVFSSGVALIDSCPQPGSGTAYVKYLELRLSAK